MAYFVEFRESVRDYLREIEGMTDDDRTAIVDEIIEELARDADRFFDQFPLSHESLCFQYDYARVTERAVFQFDFIVDASGLEMGIVRVVYAECSSNPLP